MQIFITQFFSYQLMYMKYWFGISLIYSALNIWRLFDFSNTPEFAQATGKPT